MINTATGTPRVYCLPAAATYRSLLPFAFSFRSTDSTYIFSSSSVVFFVYGRPLPMRRDYAHVAAPRRPRDTPRIRPPGCQSALPNRSRARDFLIIPRISISNRCLRKTVRRPRDGALSANDVSLVRSAFYRGHRERSLIAMDGT